jgi:hypothetical protein
VHLRVAAEIAFAAVTVVAGVTVIVAIVDRGSRRLFAAIAAGSAVVALAVWAALAFETTARIAIAASGATLAAIATFAAARIPVLVTRARAVDEELANAEDRLRTLIGREAAERSAELTRTLARARAESASLLEEQERSAAEERRRAAIERERSAAATLSTALADTQRQVDARLRAWNNDLDRMRQTVNEQVSALAQRQKQLISDAETRIAADAERLEAESEQQRVGLVRLRDELARAIHETVTSGTGELDAYAAERRRALHELNDRIRKRERALAEQIEREEAEASRRIQAAFADVERRQVEQLERILNRATSSYADLAGQQFSDAIRAAREDAARRLSRELDRAVQAFAREAERVLAEQLAHVGDAGAQRLDRRLSQVTAGLERQQGEAIAAFEQRLAGAEHELRRRLEGIVADTEAERAVLEARLQELARRIDEAMTRA